MEFSSDKDVDMVQSVLKSVFFLSIPIHFIVIIDIISLGKIHIESLH